MATSTSHISSANAFHRYSSFSKSNQIRPFSKFTLPFSPNPGKPRHPPHHHTVRLCATTPIIPATLSTTLENPLPFEETGATTFISRFPPMNHGKAAMSSSKPLNAKESPTSLPTPVELPWRFTKLLHALKSSATFSPVTNKGVSLPLKAMLGLPANRGVCIATSGPGATNLVSGLADALLDSVPIVAITGQVPRRMIGTDAFQETPIVEVTRSITKHNYLVMNVEDIPRIVKEAFFLAKSGRPGLVLIDIPKDIQQQMVVPDWDQPISLAGYVSRLPKPPKGDVFGTNIEANRESKRPVLYVGGGCLNSSEELRKFVELTGIPVASTLMGLGSYPCSDEEFSLQMLGMHGTVYANYAVDKSDLLLAFGVRFDDRVTGKLEAFASRAKIVHIDIDSAEIGKNKQPHVSICADVKLALEKLNRMLENRTNKESPDFSEWRAELNDLKTKYPLTYKTFGDAIPPQYAIQVLDELTNGNAIISTGVGQHQMWSAQFYKYNRPRQWLTSGGLGAMGFGLPAAIGAAVARPNDVVVDIDGDGSFQMNSQELATIRVENLPVKIMILNNQHLGMVVQWEDRFYGANRAHTYLGNPANELEIFPNLLKFAEGCDIPAARVVKKEDVRAAIQKMLDTPGPYLLDVIVPHQEHVLPMIPSGGAFKDVITESDGR